MRRSRRSGALLVGLSILLASAAPVLAPPQDQTVHVTSTGKVYHSAGCRLVSGRATTPMKLTDAVDAGYTPCTVCNPPKLSEATEAKAEVRATQPSAVQDQPGQSKVGSAEVESRERSVADVVKSSVDSVVLITVSDQSGKPFALGSGFIVSPDGRILTNQHVIERAHSATVKLNSGAFYQVEGILASSKRDDLALVKVAGKNLPALSLGETEKLAVGERVIAVGSPLGLENTVSDGIVSAIRELRGRKWIQTTAPISHGNSGGPLLNLEGQVVGVTSLTFRSLGGENLNFAVPIEDAKPLLAATRDSLVPLDSGGRQSINQPAGGQVFYVAYRTPRHQRYSTEDVFQGIVDEIALFVKSQNVVLLDNPTGRTIETGVRPPLYDWIRYAQRQGAGSLLFLTVDRPLGSWVKIELQCYDIAGALLWEETASNGSWASRGGAAVRKAIEAIKKSLLPRVGQKGLPVEIEQ